MVGAQVRKVLPSAIFKILYFSFLHKNQSHNLTHDLLRDGFAAGRQIKESEAGEPLTEGKVRVKLDCNDEVIEVDEDDVEKANPPSFDRVEDLAQLRYLNESSVLHTLRQR